MKQFIQIRKIGIAVAFCHFSLIASAQAPAIQWDKTFGGNNRDELTCLISTIDGGYILGGTSNSGLSGDKSQASKGFKDYWLVKLDANGNKSWDKTFGGQYDDFLQSVVQTSDGGYILGGSSYSGISGDKTQANIGDADYWVVKLDASGNKIWDKTFGGNNHDYLHHISQTSDGGYILGGRSSSGISGDKSQASKGYSDYWIIKLDNSGNKIWDKTLGGNIQDDLYSLAQTSDGGYILGGRSNSDISGDKTAPQYWGHFYYDYWIIKLDASGNKLWDKTFGGDNMDELYSVAQTSDGGYILGGFSKSGLSFDKTEASKGFNDYWLLKLDATGNKTWDKTIGGNGDDLMFSAFQTTQGGYILGGNSWSGISGDKTQASKGMSDFWVMMLGANGAKIWDKTIGGSSVDYLSNIAPTADGGYVLSGRSYSDISGDKTQNSNGDMDYWIVKLGPDATTGINEPTTSLNLTISPNPSQGKFQLQLNNLTAKTAAITISDLVGRIVYKQEIPGNRNKIQQEIILPKKGLYLMQLIAGGQRRTQKIVIE